jgi:predicted O-methyltransferase YrrM
MPDREARTAGQKEKSMPKIVDAEVEDYLRGLYDDGDPVRLEMEALARKRDFPIVGPLVGRQLLQLTLSIGARRVFELGSGYGYSALFFARGVGPGGAVHCTDLSEENVRQAEGFLRRAGVWERVTYHRQEALAALRQVGETWDIVYNDIDKTGYPETVELAYARLRPGGLFVTDNVLWSGRVVQAQGDGTPETAAIQEFTRRLFSHRGFLTRIDPTRDGVAVALRL